jgi:hypothetical protein
MCAARIALASIAASGALMLAGSASADVLINIVAPRICLGKTIEVGVWYRNDGLDQPRGGGRRRTPSAGLPPARGQPH